MSKRTPGTWIVGSVTVWSHQGGMVRRVALCEIHEGIDLDEAEANARLIAAAPDLLEAAKAICDHTVTVVAGGYVMDFNSPEWVALEAAIEKAEGGDA